MNRILTILLACCFFCVGNAQTKPKIAIFDPTAVSVSLGSGTKDAIRELISSTVVNSKRYTVLERAMLEKILQEQAFSNSGMVDDKEAVALGKFAGATKVLVSVLTSSSGKILFTVKLLDMATSDVEYQQFYYANSIGDLLENIEPTVLKLLDMEVGTYEGERKNGLPHGQGVMKYKNGGVYRGAWVNGVRQGWGIMDWGRERYEGNWFNDKEHGNGFYRYYDGREYQGEWKGGKQSGKGVLKYKNGNRFEGEFVNGEPAKGQLIYPNGDRYEGDFNTGNGSFSIRYGYDHSGHNGIMKYANGNRLKGRFFWDGIAIGVMDYTNGGRYEGRLVNGKRDDSGYKGAIMYYPNGETYKGKWVEDKRSGYGVMKWRDGSVYDGEWKDDMMHGHGRMISPKGRERTGKWLYGVKQHE